MLLGGFFYLETRPVKENLIKVQSNETRMLEDKIKVIFKYLFSDLAPLANGAPFAHHRDYSSPSFRRETESLFVSFLESKSFAWDQIRFLGMDGKEIVRVDRTRTGTWIVPTDRLQDKSDRYYFKESLRLQKGDFYLSPFDLNMEFGSIEIPWKPMIRFSTPVMGPGGKQVGVLVANYLGENLLSEIKTWHTHTSDSDRGIEHQLFLLNDSGFYLNHENSGKNWGFHFPEKEKTRFQDDYPTSWEDMKEKNSAVFTNRDGILVFTRIEPLEKISQNQVTGKLLKPRWILANLTPTSSIHRVYLNLSRKYIILFIILSIVAWILSSLFARKELARREAYERMLEALDAQKEANLLKTNFFHIIGHELNGPPGSVGTFLNILDEEIQKESPQSVARYFDLLKESLQVVFDDIEKLQFWGTLEQSSFKLDSAPFASGAEVNSLLEEWQGEATSRHLELESSMESDFTIHGDKTLFRKLVSFLLEYLIHHSEDGTISVRSGKDGTGFLRFSIQTQGKLDPDLVDRWLSGEKPPSTISEKKGTPGLTRSICKRIVELHGGRMELETGESSGDFSFIFTMSVKEWDP